VMKVELGRWVDLTIEKPVCQHGVLASIDFM